MLLTTLHPVYLLSFDGQVFSYVLINPGPYFIQVVAGASGFASSCDGELGKPLESKQGIWASSQDEVGEHGVLLPLRLETRGFS